MGQFDFHDFSGEASTAVVTIERFKNEAAARGHAGRLAKRNGGPIDLALAGAAPWKDRYVTTASSSKFHVAGYRFERLES